MLNPKKMTRYVVWLAALLVAAGGAFAQKTKKENASAEIGKVMAMQENAWNAGDLNAFMQGYWQSDSLTFVGRNGIAYGWNTTLNNYRKSYPDKETMGKLTFTLLKKEKLGPASYLVLGKWQLQRSKDEVGGYFSLVWKKIDGRWVIISDHTS
jgi:hypothetical protein